MRPNECFEILGVEPGASIHEIRGAYKRLAWQHHPDRAMDVLDATERFSRITAAYMTLRASVTNHDCDLPSANTCAKCGDFGELLKGIEGLQCCAECLLAIRKKRLPMPAMRIVRCFLPIVLQLFAIVCLIRSIQTGQNDAAIACLAALALSITFLTRDVLRSIILLR